MVALQVWSAGKLSGDDSQQPYHEIDVLAGHENDVNYVQFRLVSGCVQLKRMPSYVQIFIPAFYLCSGTAVASRSSILDHCGEENIPKFKNTWFVSLSRFSFLFFLFPR